MIPYTRGTAAVRYEPLPYVPVSFKRMRINAHSCQMYVKSNTQGDAVFELYCDNTAAMAFTFTGLRHWELRQRREAFSRLFHAELLDGSLIYFNLLPTETVETLPTYPTWETNSPLGETGFWASADLRMSVHSTGRKKSTISILLMGGLEVASFEVEGLECDDENVLDAALDLRKKLHIQQQVRIESRVDHHTVVWYIPSRFNREVRHDR